MTLERVIEMVTCLDITVGLLKLADSLETIHGLNVTQLDQDFARFANLTGKTEFDFKTVTSEIRKFQNIESMRNFNPLDIKWNEGETVSNTVRLYIIPYSIVTLSIVYQYGAVPLRIILKALSHSKNQQTYFESQL
jgi:hypothetical protein